VGNLSPSPLLPFCCPGTKLPYTHLGEERVGRRAAALFMGRAAGVLVYWSVDTNGRVFRSQDETAEESYPHVIVDSDGVEWAVREVTTPQVWAHGERCLVLNSRDCVRRVWNYPPDWRRLDADTLLALGVVDRDRAVETRPAREP